MSAADNATPSSTAISSVKDITANNGPEGRLGTYFKNAVSQTLEKFLSYIKFSLFKTNFPKICEENEGHLRNVREQLKSQLKENILKDIDNLCADTKLYPSLKLLDDIVTKHSTKNGEDSWRPSGNPEEDTRDHIYHLKQKHKKCLEFVLETMVAENELLEKSANENHADILALKKEVDALNQEINNEFEILNDDSIARLSKDIKAEFAKQ
ncbi:uncharacterized protein TNIN_165421 [Trichonephila inaurata madagascariensis]|uniref:Uncharacterized protein n=1 Tax=Trichonephila inaurata madagascariensis TaxID=2747483 RepID=A0A8X6X1Z6_9ARAC|nr:uncharacterized protein TNIN_165421 [Trichonephila inaurata madagascariensis]